jgi:hypothetical protein
MANSGTENWGELVAGEASLRLGGNKALRSEAVVHVMPVSMKGVPK